MLKNAETEISQTVRPESTKTHAISALLPTLGSGQQRIRNGQQRIPSHRPNPDPEQVRKMHFVHALLLTGTPLQNNLTELWALLNLLYPEVFTTTHAFDEAFNIGQGKLEGALLRHAHHLLQLLMLRRLKETVATR